MKAVFRRSTCSVVIVSMLGIVGINGEWWRGASDAHAGLFEELFGGGEKVEVPLPPVPVDYASKRMPEGYWTDPKIIEEGRQIFMGLVNPDVKCAKCHGEDGKPVKAGARDFRDGKKINRFSEDFWFWRISEGVPKTKMKAWKEKLTEEQRWKVMAFEHTFSHGGKAEPHNHAQHAKK